MQYEERYVAFIDILGFRNRVNKANEQPELIDRLVTALSEMLTYHPLQERMRNTEGFENTFRVSTFSDNIVISGSYNAIGASLVVNLSAHLAMRLLHHGVYARGAISKGKLIHTENIVLGEGLIRSYELESRASIYPRIIIDEQVLQAAITTQSALYSVAKDFDGIHFLNYLSPTMVTLCSGDAGTDKHYLEDARAQIVDDLSSIHDVAVKAKIVWLARNFNNNATSLGLEPIPGV